MNLATRKLPAGSVEATLNGITVVIREKDGYINATRLCKDAGKLFGHWKMLDTTAEFLEALSTALSGDLIEACVRRSSKSLFCPIS